MIATCAFSFVCVRMFVSVLTAAMTLTRLDLSVCLFVSVLRVTSPLLCFLLKAYGESSKISREYYRQSFDSDRGWLVAIDRVTSTDTLTLSFRACCCNLLLSSDAIGRLSLWNKRWKYLPQRPTVSLARNRRDCRCDGSSDADLLRFSFPILKYKTRYFTIHNILIENTYHGPLFAPRMWHAHPTVRIAQNMKKQMNLTLRNQTTQQIASLKHFRGTENRTLQIVQMRHLQVLVTIWCNCCLDLNCFKLQT